MMHHLLSKLHANGRFPVYTLFSVLMICLTLLMGLSGCDKVPTFNELTNQEQPAQQPPQQVEPPKQQEPPPEQNDPTPEPVQMSAAEVIANFQSLRPDQITDDEVAKLASVKEGLDVITELDLTGTKCTEGCFPHLAKLPALRTLNVSRIGFSPAGFAELKALPQLESLVVLSSPQPGTFRDSQDPTSQTLDKDLQVISEIPTLKKLNLAGSKITEESLKQIAQNTGLEVLVLSETAITDDGLGLLSGLVNLRELYLKRTAISDVGLLHLSKFDKLQVLDLAETSVAGAGLQQVRKRNGLPSLIHINVYGNNLSREAYLAIKGMKKLEYLNIGKTNAVNKAMDMVKGMKDLKELIISNNPQLSSACMVHIKPLRNLERFVLNNNKLFNDSTLAGLTKHEKLKTLLVGGTSITPAGVAKLKKDYIPELSSDMLKDELGAEVQQ